MRRLFIEEDGSETLEALAVMAVAAVLAGIAIGVFKLAKGKITGKAKEAFN